MSFAIGTNERIEQHQHKTLFSGHRASGLDTTNGNLTYSSGSVIPSSGSLAGLGR